MAYLSLPRYPRGPNWFQSPSVSRKLQDSLSVSSFSMIIRTPISHLKLLFEPRWCAQMNESFSPHSFCGGNHHADLLDIEPQDIPSHLESIKMKHFLLTPRVFILLESSIR